MSAEHPEWCARRHPDTDWPVHDGQIGADLALSHELAYTVRLQRVADSPTQVILARHVHHEVTVTRLSIVEAAILRDLLSEGLDLIEHQARHA